MAPLVAGIVLAAGRSTRMGSPKALLEIGGETFLGRAVRVLVESGCDPVLAIVPRGESERMGGIAEAAGGRAVVNPQAEAEQVDSLRLALDVLTGVDAAIVLPVDFPRSSPDVVRAVLDAWVQARAPIARPVFEGQPGHPVLFARSLWPELLEPDLEEGARDVVHRHRDEILEVPVDDPGTTTDVDTPADYMRVVGRAGQEPGGATTAEEPGRRTSGEP